MPHLQCSGPGCPGSSSFSFFLTELVQNLQIHYSWSLSQRKKQQQPYHKGQGVQNPSRGCWERQSEWDKGNKLLTSMKCLKWRDMHDRGKKGKRDTVSLTPRRGWVPSIRVNITVLRHQTPAALSSVHDEHLSEAITHCMRLFMSVFDRYFVFFMVEFTV